MSELGWATAGAGSGAGPALAFAEPSGPTAMASSPDYPVRAGLNAPIEVARWRVIGNYILGIPHFLLLYVYNLVAEVFLIAGWFAALFTGRMPEGIGNFVAGVHRYQWRVMTYILFLREDYPSFSLPSGYSEPGGDPAWLQITPTEKYSRAAVFFRGLLAIPQMVFGLVLFIAFYVVWIVAFFAVLFTGRWPEGLRKFALGVGFWMVRTNAWYSLLADKYPPFSID